jgi:glycosyltransferase involved in cell wall biosynthesis
MVRGDCVGFVDADDWIDPGMLTGMLDAMIASDAEMVICDYRKVFADGSTKVFRYQQTGTAGLDPHDDPRLIFGCGYSPWNKVVRKRMFEEHGCYFPEGMIFQDMVAFVRMISRSRKVVNTGAVAYNYRIREGSLLHSMNPSAYDIFKALELLQQTLDRRFEAELEFLAMKELFYASMPRVVRYGGSDARRFFERSVTFLEERFPGWRQNRYLKERGWWHRWYMFGIGKRCYRCVRVLALLKKIGRY